jgi:DNA mismatch endonuclease (patch repair protein)
VDKISKQRRSWNMSRIRNKNTKPEVRVRSILHRIGYRFRIHVRQLPGCPDIVLPRWKSAIFVHGCFWHQHPGCKFAYTPKSKKAFWRAKFMQNAERDAQAIAQLRSQGWNPIVIWECELKDPLALQARLKNNIRDAPLVVSFKS